jgi:hypothetical protein
MIKEMCVLVKENLEKKIRDWVSGRKKVESRGVKERERIVRG